MTLITDEIHAMCDMKTTTFDDARGEWKVEIKFRYETGADTVFYAAQANDVDGAQAALGTQLSSAVSHFSLTLHYFEFCATLGKNGWG